jgi:hypothetical protein
MNLMNNTLRQILFIVVISLQLITVVSISSSNVIIDVDVGKGIALQHIGIYSDKLEQSIFHMFIPYHDLCVDSPNSEVCAYAQTTNPDVINVGTIVPFSEHMPTINRRENLSGIALEDIRRIHSRHPVNQFMDKTKSIIYFIDDQFYIPGRIVKPATMNVPSSASMDPRTLVHRSNHQAK